MNEREREREQLKSTALGLYTCLTTGGKYWGKYKQQKRRQVPETGSVGKRSVAISRSGGKEGMEPLRCLSLAAPKRTRLVSD